MGFKKYRFKIIFRLLILVGMIFLLVHAVNKGYVLTPVIVGVLILLIVFEMFWFIDRTNRDLINFLESIRNDDFTQTYEIDAGGSIFGNLNKVFNDVIKDFQKIRAEKEENYHYLQTVVQNLDVGVMVYTRKGKVKLMNKATHKLFQVSHLEMVQDLGKMSEELTYVLLHIKPGETRLVKIQEEDDLLQLSIHAVEIRIGEEFIVVSSIANLQNVLEYQETESWQKLIRVLTHEIMNSIAPIASLSSTLNQIMTGNNEDTVCEDLSTEELEEIRGALQTIHKRSTGLLHFVESYRNLTRIPQPNFRIAKIDRMLRQIATLNYEQLKRHGIDFEIIVCPEDMEVSIDEELISQVLINLIQNSIHALEETEKPKIEINGFYNKRGRPTLTVKDNGPGILPDVIDKIFIPFFTTKPEGSGIGLSLSKQILRLHNGTITAKSQPGNDTTFILTF